MINIKTDSRRIKEGDIFVAIKGIGSDGHDYIDKAIKNGAKKVVVMKKGNYEVPCEVVKDTREYLVNYLKKNYGKKVLEMNIVGITGTNGKTTSCYLLYDALNKLDIKCAYLGTLGFYLKDGLVEALNNTTPDICEVYEMIIYAYENGYRNFVLEASSQGLIKGRLDTIPFNYAVFTNLTIDHLDEHKTMENYAKAKALLFDKVENDGLSIVNYDDSYKKYFKSKNTLYYGFKGGDYKVKKVTYNHDSTIIKYSFNDEVFTLKSPLLGKYNVYNLLSVIIILRNMNISVEKINDVVKLLSSPPGRMDIIKYNSNSIIIDYAHTPDAMENIFSTVKEIKHNNLYVVFGCTGDRDRKKRPIMMNLATSNCKRVIVTIDDPHNEDPNIIFSDMTLGNFSSNYEIILDRGYAIQKGISLLDSNDILLILGKGHEEFIIQKDEKIPFNDRKKVIEILNLKGNRS